jgi:flagellar basal-body rod modification protein FlgD
MQIANQPNAAQQPAAYMFNAQPEAAASTSGASANPGTATATVTANDFLQLLVTELQNQDPTANTDPNEYVNQLVQVNTLQQQIQMNQTLDGGPTLTGAGSGILQQLEGINDTLNGDLTSAGASANARSAPASLTAKAAARPASSGNLSIGSDAKSGASAAAVAEALVPHKGPVVPAAQSDAFRQFAARIKASAGK